MLIEGKRPRELRWFHAGPMLFGDWGTSRLYVLGLAFFYTQHASLWFMGAMSFLLVAVGWAYQIICRTHPDGGGVYSSAKHRSQALAVVGGLLLCADYLVTAAISSLDAFHYLDVPYPALWAALSIVAIGVINYFGPRKAGTLALLVAVVTIAFTLVLAGAAAPSMPEARIASPQGSPVRWWTQFTSLILAISGVEAIANMTGIMVHPVERTSTHSIWPVMTEIVVLNVLLTLAMLAVPADVLGAGDASQAHVAHRDDMLRAMSEYYIGPKFAAAASLVFALLLLSASNTALTDLVSIQYMLARDRELPRRFAALNVWGMPLMPLVVATIAPAALVLVVPDIGALADLYAIGVVGAVAINLWTTSTNAQLAIRRWERGIMLGLGVFMTLVWLTIAYEKPHALFFAGAIMVVGLATRYVVHNWEQVRGWTRELVRRPALPAVEAAVPAAAMVSELSALAAEAETGFRPRILIPTRGNPKMLKYALDEAKARGAEALFLFVRHIAVPTMGPDERPQRQ
jgi:hypothetical protein